MKDFFSLMVYGIYSMIALLLIAYLVGWILS